MATYQIYELSARAVMSYAAEKDGVYIFALNRTARYRAPSTSRTAAPCSTS